MDKLKAFLHLGRYHRPIGAWLLFFPAAWSITLHTISWRDLGLFLIGAFLMRGAGCTYNDWVDRDVDRYVERTKSRPLPSGRLSPKEALFFLGIQLFLSALVLLTLPPFTILLGLLSLGLVALYPWMKRLTYWPQIFLGFSFGWGAFMGESAVLGSLTWKSALVFLISSLWVLGYDTIYAYQDREDDVLIGVKSSALAVGEDPRFFLMITYSLVALGLLCFASSWVFLPFWTVAAFLLFWQALTLNPRRSEDCLKKFVSNQWVGFVIFLGLIAQRIL